MRYFLLHGFQFGTGFSANRNQFTFIMCFIFCFHNFHNFWVHHFYKFLDRFDDAVFFWNFF